MRSLRAGIIVLYALTMLAVPCAIVWSARHDYQRTLEDMQQQTLSLARLLHEHCTRSIVSVEQAMQNIREDITRLGGVDQMDEYWGHVRLKEKVKQTPQIRAIIAIDEAGILRIHGQEFPTRRVDLSDREYFIAHRNSVDEHARVGNPLISRTDDKWLIPITHRINYPDGQFGGVMLAGVEPNYFLSFYESLKLSPDTRIQLVRHDGTVLLTYPLDTGIMGRNLQNFDPQGYAQLGKTSPAFYAAVNFQNKKSYITQLSGHQDAPAIVRISTDHDQVFSKFRQETISKAASAAALMLVVSILLYLLLRQIKQVEDAESRLYFTQFAVDESPDMILWCDRTGRVRYANRCLVETSDYQIDELLKLRYTDLIIDDQETWHTLSLHMLLIKRQPTNTTLRTELQAQRRQILQSKLRSRTGGLTPVEITLSLIEFNTEVYLCVSARDISERQETEIELRQHRDHLQEMVEERTAEIRTVLDASPLAIVLSVTGQIRLANHAFESLFGYEAATIVGQHEQLIYDDAENYQKACFSINHHLVIGGSYRGEMQLRRRDGSNFWALLFARAINPQSPERGMILVIEDITAQRIAAQAVRQSERIKRTIIDTTADGFALIDARRRIVDVNASFCELLGFERADLIDHSPDDLWGGLGEHLFPRCPNSAAEKHFEEIELPGNHGLTRPFLANGGVIPGEGGDIEYTFVFLTDISRQKEIERNLFESKEAAEEANMAKTGFLANMSHELRTPMHAILSYSEMGIHKMNQIAPEQTIRYFERIQTSGKRLLALLNDLLDMSRLEANKMTYDKCPQILQETVEGVITEISPLLASKQLQMHIDRQTLPLRTEYDKARLTQVLVNLLSNAIKFSPPGSEIRIEYIPQARLKNGHQAIGLSVRDFGPGIPGYDLERIFDTFAQSKHPLSSGGTGLGLAISRQIMRDHQGSIEARNHPDGGAVFTLLLPAENSLAATGITPADKT